MKSLLSHVADQNCREMSDLGAVSSLVKLLSSSEKTTRAYAALSLSVMTNTGTCVGGAVTYGSVSDIIPI